MVSANPEQVGLMLVVAYFDLLSVQVAILPVWEEMPTCGSDFPLSGCVATDGGESHHFCTASLNSLNVFSNNDPLGVDGMLDCSVMFGEECQSNAQECYQDWQCLQK